jgi:antitoxin CcdA
MIYGNDCGVRAMGYIYNTEASRKVVTVAINGDLLEKARELDISLSATLEEALFAQVRADHHAQWLRDNSDGTRAYNQFVDSYGTFSDSIRKF